MLLRALIPSRSRTPSSVSAGADLDIGKRPRLRILEPGYVCFVSASVVLSCRGGCMRVFQTAITASVCPFDVLKGLAT